MANLASVLSAYEMRLAVFAYRLRKIEAKCSACFDFWSVCHLCGFIWHQAFVIMTQTSVFRRIYIQNLVFSIEKSRTVVSEWLLLALGVMHARGTASRKMIHGYEATQGFRGNSFQVLIFLVSLRSGIMQFIRRPIVAFVWFCVSVFWVQNVGQNLVINYGIFTKSIDFKLRSFCMNKKRNFKKNCRFSELWMMIFKERNNNFICMMI